MGIRTVLVIIRNTKWIFFFLIDSGLWSCMKTRYGGPLRKSIMHNAHIACDKNQFETPEIDPSTAYVKKDNISSSCGKHAQEWHILKR